MKMKELQIRTADRTLACALESWWQDFSGKAPEGRWIISDIDTVPPLQVPGEITLSALSQGDLCRPFSMSELEKLLMGEGSEREERPSGKRLVLTENRAWLDGRELQLSPLEFRMLSVLKSAERPLSADEISMALWGEQRTSNQVNVYISYLRKKTELLGMPRLIYTVRGKGFYLNDE